MKGRGLQGEPRVPRAYRALLWLLPGWLRDRHGRAMEASFADTLERARGAGFPALTGAWLRGAGDVLRRALYERFRRRGDVPSASLRTTLAPDARFAFRGFVRQPGMTLLSVVMLSVGVGACAAVFNLTDALFLRPLPFPDPGRLVYLNETAPRWNLEYTAINHADHAVWRERSRTFEAMGLFGGSSYAVADEAGAERYAGLRVTYDLGPALGIRPVLGRHFTPEEDSPDGPQVVMLGHDVWKDRFGGDADVVGRAIRLNRVPRTIVGVLPPEADVVRRAQLWVPLARDPLDASQGYSFTGIGRLKPGVTLAEARADLEQAHAPIWAERDTAHVVSPVVMPLRERLAGDSRPVAIALGLAVALVLLIACGNVASILLARSFARRRELGIRVALGASTGRIARQLLAESLTLAVVAAPLGLVLGFGMIRGFTALLPDQLPSWLDLSVDWRTGLFALLLVLATAVIFGWAPVAQVGRQDARDALAEGGGRASAPRRQRRTMNLLVVAEMTLAALLLVGGGLLFRTFQQLQQTDPGFRTEDVVGFRVALPDAAYPDSAARDRLYTELVAGIEAIPGVRAAGAVSCPPLGGCHLGNFFHAVGLPGPGPDEQSPVVLTRFATAEYFRVMDIPLVRGRLFEPSDGRVAVINETFARQFFPGIDDPVGREVDWGSRPDPEDAGPFIRVIGVVRDVKHYGVDEDMRPGIYFDSHAMPRSGMAIMAWTAVEPSSLVPSIRRMLQELDPELPMYAVGTTGEALRDSLAQRRVVSWVIAGFAGMALLLALGGIYGVLSYLVGQRGHEIGIRMAMGATRRDVVGLVVWGGMKLAGAGTVLGFLAALGLTATAGQGLADMLVGQSPRDPATFAGAAALLTITTLLATLAPAARAVGVEPQSALREE